MTVCAADSLNAAKIPPVCSQRTPSCPNRWPQSTSPGLSCDAAVWPRSETPTAPRTPKPRSVKFSPLRTERPIPSYGTHRMNEVSRPPVRMKSSTRRPLSLSASAVTIAPRRPNARRRPRATLYSPPPSQARNDLAVRIRPSPGSRRSITSPRDTASKRHTDAGRMLRSAIVILLVLVSHALRRYSRGGSAGGQSQGHGVGRELPDGGEVSGLDAVARNHPRAADRGHRTDRVLRGGGAERHLRDRQATGD